MKKQNQSDRGQNRIHVHVQEDEVRAFQKKEKKNDKTLSPLVIMFLVWAVLFIFSLFCVVSYNQVTFSAAWFLKYAGLNVRHFYNFLFRAGDTGNVEVTFYKLLGIAVIGAALASCGAVLQGCFRNVMAGPSTTGVMAGGTLGCTLYLLFFTSSASTVSNSLATSETAVTTANLDLYEHMTFFEKYTYQFCVLAGCIFGVLLIVTIATIAGKGKVSSSAMLISGMVFSTVISNVNMLIQYYMILKNPDDERIDAIRDMMMGTFDNIINLQVLLMMGIPLLILLVILLRIRGKLNLLSMGSDEAMTAGMNVQAYQRGMMMLSAVLTALVVAFCGHIGFVGYMVPLITRRVVGPDMKKLVPASMLTGMILLTVIYDLSDFLLISDSINLITSGVGCMVMLLALLNGKGGEKNAFNQGRGMAGMGFR